MLPPIGGIPGAPIPIPPMGPMGGMPPTGAIPGGIPPTDPKPLAAPVIMSCEPGIMMSRSWETKSSVVVVTFSFSLVCSFLISFSRVRISETSWMMKGITYSYMLKRQAYSRARSGFTYSQHVQSVAAKNSFSLRSTKNFSSSSTILVLSASCAVSMASRQISSRLERLMLCSNLPFLRQRQAAMRRNSRRWWPSVALARLQESMLGYFSMDSRRDSQSSMSRQSSLSASLISLVLVCCTILRKGSQSCTMPSRRIEEVHLTRSILFASALSSSLICSGCSSRQKVIDRQQRSLLLTFVISCRQVSWLKAIGECSIMIVTAWSNSLQCEYRYTASFHSMNFWQARSSLVVFSFCMYVLQCSISFSGRCFAQRMASSVKMPMWARSRLTPASRTAIISLVTPSDSQCLMSPSSSSGCTMMFMAAVLASLYSCAPTQAMQTSRQVFVVLAFLAASMAAEYSLRWMRQEAIFELFFTIVQNFLAASQSRAEKQRSPTFWQSAELVRERKFSSSVSLSSLAQEKVSALSMLGSLVASRTMIRYLMKRGYLKSFSSLSGSLSSSAITRLKQVWSLHLRKASIAQVTFMLFKQVYPSFDHTSAWFTFSAQSSARCRSPIRSIRMSSASECSPCFRQMTSTSSQSPTSSAMRAMSTASQLSSRLMQSITRLRSDLMAVMMSRFCSLRYLAKSLLCSTIFSRSVMSSVVSSASMKDCTAMITSSGFLLSGSSVVITWSTISLRCSLVSASTSFQSSFDCRLTRYCACARNMVWRLVQSMSSSSHCPGLRVQAMMERCGSRSSQNLPMTLGSQNWLVAKNFCGFWWVSTLILAMALWTAAIWMFSETRSSSQLSRMAILLRFSNSVMSSSMGTAERTILRMPLMQLSSHSRSMSVPRTTGMACGFWQTLKRQTSMYLVKLFLQRQRVSSSYCWCASQRKMIGLGSVSFSSSRMFFTLIGSQQSRFPRITSSMDRSCPHFAAASMYLWCTSLSVVELITVPRKKKMPSKEPTLSSIFTMLPAPSFCRFWTATLTTICRFWRLKRSISCMQARHWSASILPRQSPMKSGESACELSSTRLMSLISVQFSSARWQSPFCSQSAAILALLQSFQIFICRMLSTICGAIMMFTSSTFVWQLASSGRFSRMQSKSSEVNSWMRLRCRKRSAIWCTFRFLLRSQSFLANCSAPSGLTSTRLRSCSVQSISKPTCCAQSEASWRRPCSLRIWMAFWCAFASWQMRSASTLSKRVTRSPSSTQLSSLLPCAHVRTRSIFPCASTGPHSSIVSSLFSFPFSSSFWKQISSGCGCPGICGSPLNLLIVSAFRSSVPGESEAILAALAQSPLMMKLLNCPRKMLSTPGRLYLLASEKTSCWMLGRCLQLVIRWGRSAFSSISPPKSEPFLLSARMPSLVRFLATAKMACVEMRALQICSQLLIQQRQTKPNLVTMYSSPYFSATTSEIGKSPGADGSQTISVFFLNFCAPSGGAEISVTWTVDLVSPALRSTKQKTLECCVSLWRRTRPKVQAWPSSSCCLPPSMKQS